MYKDEIIELVVAGVLVLILMAVGSGVAACLWMYALS